MKNKGFYIKFPEISSEEIGKSFWDEFPWFAIAKWRDDQCIEVFMTKDWNSYTEEWYKTKASGNKFIVWCGTYREVDNFRQRSQSPKKT